MTEAVVWKCSNVWLNEITRSLSGPLCVSDMRAVIMLFLYIGKVY